MVKLYIEESLEKFREIESLLDENDSKLEEDLFITGKDIYKYLNYSILSGEYLQSYFNDALEKFKTAKIDVDKKLQSTGLLYDSDIVRKVFDFTQLIEDKLDLYSLHIHMHNKSIESPEITYLDYETSDESNKVSAALDYLASYSEVFDINIDLMFLDREFYYSSTFLHTLQKIARKLDKLKLCLDEDYLNIMIDKNHILMSKFNYKSEENFNVKLLLTYYSSMEAKVALNVSEMQFKYDWTNLATKYHEIYTQSLYQDSITEYFKKFNQNNPCVSFFDYFVRCHYFKNIVSNIKLLDDLINEFQTKKDKLQCAYDIHCFKASLNYLHNCRLSLNLTDNALSLSDVENEQKKIKDIQDDTGVRNYFPYIKLATWYSNFITTNSNNTDLLDKLEIAVTKFDYCLEHATKYLNASNCCAGSFIPFKPTYNECLNKIQLSNGESLNVFISTGYIIPVDFQREKKRIEKLRSEYLVCRAIVETENHIHGIKKYTNQLETDFKLKVENVDKSVRDAQKDNLQILAIFAGIVIFASGTIQIFTGATSIKDASIFMLLFASAIGLISTSLWLLSKSFQRKNWLVALILVILLLFNTCAIFCDWGNTKINNSANSSKTEIKTF